MQFAIGAGCDGQLVIVILCCFTDIRLATDGTLSITIANDFDMNDFDISSDEMDVEDDEQNGWTSGTHRGNSISFLHNFCFI